MRTVCLTTPIEDPARHAASVAHFAAVGLTDVRYFHGLHADTSGLSTTHPYMVDRPEPDAERFVMGPKPTLIWLGHYFLWQALAVSDDDHWLVLECDARFEDGWRQRIAAALGHVPPGFDFLYVGSCCTGGRPKTHIAGDVYQMTGIAPQCNHAYVLARKAALVLAETLRRVWAPIDIQQVSETFQGGYALPRSLPFIDPGDRRLKAYVVLPRIVGQFDTEIPE